MTKTQAEKNSTIYNSLKHPARRKILKLASKGPISFSQMLKELNFSTSQLFYHIENLGKLITKTNEGKYQLSNTGKASFDTLKAIEETITDKPKQEFPLKWKSIIAVMLIATIALASFSVFQYTLLNQLSSENNSIENENRLLNLGITKLLAKGADTNRPLDFIEDVIQFDLSKYHIQLLNSDAKFRSDLGGFVEETSLYSLTNNEDKFDIALRFRDQLLSTYQILDLNGSPIYYEPQPSDLLDAAANLLDRYKIFGDASYLEEMKNLLSGIEEIENIEILQDNMKLKVTSFGNETEFVWVYSKDGLDYSPKSLSLIFQGDILRKIIDGWFLFENDSFEVNISEEEAIRLARSAVSDFTWSYEGEIVSDFLLLEDVVDVEFVPHPRDAASILVPYWYVTFGLDGVYPGDVGLIAVGLWADNGEIVNIRVLTTV